MLWHFFIKDLKRARANPWPYLIFLALPICVTALIGMIFGPRQDGGGKLAKIKIAIVDQDQSLISQFVRSAFNQGDAQEHLEATFLDETAARERIEDNQISAIVIIPENFTDDFLRGQSTRSLQVIKNPAQTVYPGIVEQLMLVVSEGLSAISQNFGEEFPEILSILEKEGRPDLQAMAKIMTRIGRKFEQAEDYLFPPLVTYADSIEAEDVTADDESGTKPEFNLLGFLLPMLSSMFLLWLADGALRDIYREVRSRTFDRFRTLNTNVLFFILTKVFFAWMVVIIGSCLLFSGGGLLLGVDWKHPLELSLLAISFAFCSTGLVLFLIALARNERRSDMLNGVVIMGMSFVGGSIFNVEGLPSFLRDLVSPWLPNYWFIQAFQNVEFGSGSAVWWIEAFKMLGAGLLLILVSTWVLNTFLRKGLRP